MKMTLKNDKYTYRITWSSNDQEYVGLCVEFPIMSWIDENQDNALEGIRKVVAEIVQDMILKGESPPPPLSNKKFSGKFVVQNFNRKGMIFGFG